MTALDWPAADPDPTNPTGAAAPVEPAAPVPSSAGPVPTIGVDPGQTWTAAVLRVADHAVYGWTLGPPGPDGQLMPSALNKIDNWVGFGSYARRIVAALDELVEYAIREYGEVRVAVEVPHVPTGYGELAKRPNKMPVQDWVMPRQVACVVLGAYPAAKTVTPDGFGRRPTAEYPKELRGRKPPHWGPNEARQGERDHQRAAYDVAGVAARLPR